MICDAKDGDVQERKETNDSGLVPGSRPISREAISPRLYGPVYDRSFGYKYHDKRSSL